MLLPKFQKDEKQKYFPNMPKEVFYFLKYWKRMISKSNVQVTETLVGPGILRI